MDLGRNNLSEFFSESTLPLAQQFPVQLKFLNLSHNQLTGFNATDFGTFHSLETLSFSNNELEVLPLEVLLVSTLERLDLHHNNLVAIPMNLGQLSRLVYLDLKENAIKYLPPSLVRVPASRHRSSRH